MMSDNGNKNQKQDSVPELKDVVMDSLAPKTKLAKEAVATGSAAMLGLIMAASSFVMAVHLEYKAWKTDTTPKVAVVDEGLLNGSVSYEIMKKACRNPEKAQSISKKRVAQLSEVIKTLRESGYVIINKSAVLSYPEGNDITEQVAELMDLEIVTPEQASQFPCGDEENPLNGNMDGDDDGLGEANDGSLD
jgi:hypothetical protein